MTILFGGLTWKHERLIEGLLAGSNYRCQRLPETDRAAHEIGKEYCASGLCNPVYFTVGNLIRFLKQKQQEGFSPTQIVKQYVYFTAACGGPCRFGMYEAAFRTALNAAGFTDFRVLSFSQDHGIHASSGHTGLNFSVDFGMNAMHSFILGDQLNALQRRLGPYEVHSGATQRAAANATELISNHFKNERGFELCDHLPGWTTPKPESLWYRVPNTLGKMWSHLYGRQLNTVLPAAAAELDKVEVDWLRVRPVVKVIGEFWAQMTESDGNFRMLDFLEKEGAEVSIEPISTWLLYLLHSRKAQALHRRRMARYTAPWSSPRRAASARLSATAKAIAFSIGERIYSHHFKRLARLMGVPDLSPTSQRELAEMAAPYYNTFLRGGEGHLEVGKTLYYTRTKMCHLVLALKPFGCLPSIQSDGVQAALMERYQDVSFLSIETAGEGEVHAYSRVQMALAEARAKAAQEFKQALRSARHSLEEIRSFVAEHRELRHPLYSIPRRAGVITTAANFLLHADHLMSAGASNTGPKLHRVIESSPVLDAARYSGD